jgi:hypothetical protein
MSPVKKASKFEKVLPLSYSQIKYFRSTETDLEYK